MTEARDTQVQGLPGLQRIQGQHGQVRENLYHKSENYREGSGCSSGAEHLPGLYEGLGPNTQDQECGEKTSVIGFKAYLGPSHIVYPGKDTFK